MIISLHQKHLTPDHSLWIKRVCQMMKQSTCRVMTILRCLRYKTPQQEAKQVDLKKPCKEQAQVTFQMNGWEWINSKYIKINNNAINKYIYNIVHNILKPIFILCKLFFPLILEWRLYAQDSMHAIVFLEVLH